MYRFMFLWVMLCVLAVPLISAQEIADEQPLWVKGYGSIVLTRATPDNHQIVVSTSTGLYLFDPGAPQDKPLHLEGHTDTVLDVSFSTDGTLMASSSFDGTVRLWHLPDGAPIWSVRISDPYCVPYCDTHGLTPRSSQFNDEGTLLAVSTGTMFPGPAFAINVQSGASQMLKNPFFPPPPTIGFHKNRLLSIATREEKTFIEAIHAKRDEFVTEQVAEIENIASAHYSSWAFVDEFIAILDSEGALIAYNLEDETQQIFPDGPPLEGTYKNVVYGYDEDGLKAVNLATGQRVTLPAVNYTSSKSSAYVTYTPSLGIGAILDLETFESKVIVSKSTSDTLFEGAHNGYVLFHDEYTLKLFDPNSGESHSLQEPVFDTIARGFDLFVADGNALVMDNMNDSSIVGIWDAATGKNIVPPTRYDYLNFQWMTQDHTRMVISTDSRETNQKGLLIADLKEPSLRFFPSEKIAVPGLLVDDTLFFESQGYAMLDMMSVETVRFASESGPIIDFVFSPDSTVLATVDAGAMHLWDVISGQLQQIIPLTKPPKSIAFAEDGIVILTSSGTLQFLHLSTGTISESDKFFNSQKIVVHGSTVAVMGERDVQLMTLSNGQFTPDKILSSGDPYDLGTPPYTAIAVSDTYVAASRATPSARNGRLQNTLIDLWDKRTGVLFKRIISPSIFEPYNLNFYADGSRLALTTGEMTVVWETNNWDEPLFTTPGGTGGTVGGNTLVRMRLGLMANQIMLMRADNGDYIATLQRTANSTRHGGGEGYQVPVAASPDGTYLAGVEPHGELVVWRVPEEIETNEALIPATCDALNLPSPLPYSDQSITIEWSWSVTELSLMYDHFSAAKYEIILDGNEIPTWEVQRSIVRRDSANDDEWIVNFRLDVGVLDPGSHTIAYRVEWFEAISDGVQEYGPDTEHPEVSGTCHFTVQGEEEP